MAAFLSAKRGHSKRRILHVQDMTGKAIETALLAGIAKSDSIDTFEHYFAMDLITPKKLAHLSQQDPPAEDRVLGLYAFNTQSGQVETFRARCILLATGGIGQIYQYSTNPSIATGDGLAMAFRAGVEVRNMEFVQFHPTAFYSRDSGRFLISEAVRGEGAVLRNLKGEAFMARYDRRKDLAPRDIVARAIDAEMKQSGAAHVWLDIRGQSAESLRKRFPAIYQHCADRGIFIERDLIPVVPAAHYLCGGIHLIYLLKLVCRTLSHAAKLPARAYMGPIA